MPPTSHPPRCATVQPAAIAGTGDARNRSPGSRSSASCLCRHGIGAQAVGRNYGELALLLWNELKRLRIARSGDGWSTEWETTLSRRYGVNVYGVTLDGAVAAVAGRAARAGIQSEVDTAGRLPILRESSCPYPDLAAVDRGICDLEQEVFRRCCGVPMMLRNVARMDIAVANFNLAASRRPGGH